MNLQERWIQAMSKATQSLVGYNGYNQEDAGLMSRLFRENVPKGLTRQHVLELEVDVESKISSYPALKEDKPLAHFKANEFVSRQKGTKRAKRAVILNPDDYPSPWCVVKKDGQIIRYEDAYGRPIPELLWPINKN